MSFVSVLIAVRNAEATLPALLDALERQTLGAGAFEVLVADDASDDRTAAIAAARPGVRLLRGERREGAYAARNRALAHARGDVIAVTDGDCRPDPGWLAAAAEDLDALGADLLGGRIVTPLGPRPRLAELVDVARHWDQEHFVRAQSFAAFANFACRRAVFDAIGPFDGSVTADGDRAFCLRARAAGLTIAYSPRAVVVHPPRASRRELVRKCWRHGAGRAQTCSPILGTGGVRDLVAARSGRYGAGALRANGAAPTRGTLARVDVAGWLYAGAPGLAGYLVERARRRDEFPAARPS